MPKFCNLHITTNDTQFVGCHRETTRPKASHIHSLLPQLRRQSPSLVLPQHLLHTAPMKHNAQDHQHLPRFADKRAQLHVLLRLENNEIQYFDYWEEKQDVEANLEPKMQLLIASTSIHSIWWSHSCWLEFNRCTTCDRVLTPCSLHISFQFKLIHRKCRQKRWSVDPHSQVRHMGR